MNILPTYPNTSIVIPRRQTGFSLVEMLVALVIGLFLMVGIIQLFIGSKQSYRYHDALSRLQENGRFALNIMTQDIRMAGDRGCVSPNTPGSFSSILNSSTTYIWNFNQPIQGFESTGDGAWAPTLDPSFESPMGGGNVDAITIRGADPLAGSPVLAHGSGGADLQIPASHSYAACDIAVVASCTRAVAFQVTGVSGGNLAHATGGCSPGNTTNNLGDDFVNGDVIPMATKSYYIRAGISGMPALWRRRNDQAPQELVEGIERMQIRYGMCTGEGAQSRVNPPYVNANAVTNWASVCSARIDLLLVSSTNNLLDKPDGTTHTVIFPTDTGTAITFPASDRRLRQAFSATVGIRSHLP